MNASSSGQSVRRRRRLAATAVRDVANRRRSFHRQAIKKNELMEPFAWAKEASDAQHPTTEAVDGG